jgi:FtsH-binding integral membrane protein
MAACGTVGALSGVNFSNMSRFLMFALLGLIVVGIFIPMSQGVLFFEIRSTIQNSIYI